MVGKAKQNGGSEMGKQPPCQSEGWNSLPLWHEMLLPT